MKLNSTVELEKQIVALQKDNEILAAKAQVDRAKLQVEFWQDRANRQTEVAKLQAEIGSLQGEIKGLKIASDCPHCKNLETKMLDFLDKMTQTVMGAKLEAPARILMTPNYTASEKSVVNNPIVTYPTYRH